MKFDIQKTAAVLTIVGAVIATTKFLWPLFIQMVAMEVLKYL